MAPGSGAEPREVLLRGWQLALLGLGLGAALLLLLPGPQGPGARTVGALSGAGRGDLTAERCADGPGPQAAAVARVKARAPRCAGRGRPRRP